MKEKTLVSSIFNYHPTSPSEDFLSRPQLSEQMWQALSARVAEETSEAAHSAAYHPKATEGGKKGTRFSYKENYQTLGGVGWGSDINPP